MENKEGGLGGDLRTLRLWETAGVLVVLVIISLLSSGVGIGIRNHSIQIPAVKHMLDPGLYPYGSYGECLSSYYSWYWSVVAFASRYFGLTAALITAHVITRLVLFTGIFSLGYSLFKSRAVALTAVGLAVLGLRTILVTNTTITDQVPTHTIFAMALSVWALKFLWERKVIACAIVLGIICQVNLMNGILLGVVFAVTVVFNIRSFWSWRLPAACVVFLLVSSTVLLWALRSGGPDVSMVEYTQALKRFFYYHMYPLRWETDRWIQLGGLLAVTGLCFFSKGSFPRKGLMLATLFGIGLTWFVALWVSVADPLKPLMRLQWARTCSLLVLMILPIVSYVILEVVPGKRPLRLLLWCAVLIGGWFVAHGYAAAMLVAAVCGWSIARYHYKLSSRNSGQRVVYLAAVVLALGVSVMTGIVLAGNFAENGFKIQSQPKNWISVQLWAKENTSKDAVFLTPPNQIGFYVFSERSAYFTRKNQGAILVCPHHTGEVLDKYKELLSLNFWSEPLKDVDWAGIKRLCLARGIDYIVLPADMQIDLKTVYSNEDWVIYDVGPWKERHGQSL